MYQPNKGNILSNQSAITQEPTPSNFFVESAIQKEAVEPEIEVIPDPNLEFFIVTPEPSQDTELVEEPQQQEDEVNQDVATHEPTSLEILAEAPSQPRTTDPEVELIPDVEMGEDEQMQSQLSRDTEVFGEQYYISRDVEIETQEEVVTQEPTSSQLNAEAAKKEFQEKDVVTQEPTSSESMVEVPT